MTSGDRIELGDLQVATSFTYDSSSATLTIFNGSGTKLGALRTSRRRHRPRCGLPARG